MSRELLKQALYALKYHSIQTRPIDLTNETIEALRQELSKPEQASNEPPDYVEPPTSDYHNGWEEGFEAAKNLYPQKTKREWYGLSDKDCDKAWEHAQKSSPYGVTRIEVFAKDASYRERCLT